MGLSEQIKRGYIQMKRKKNSKYQVTFHSTRRFGDNHTYWYWEILGTIDNNIVKVEGDICFGRRKDCIKNSKKFLKRNNF